MSVCVCRGDIRQSSRGLGWRGLTERRCAGGAPQEVVEAFLAITGASNAVPHLQHGDLCAQAHLGLQFLNFLQSKVTTRPEVYSR